MRLGFRGPFILLVQAFVLVFITYAQLGNSGSIEGVVKDPSGAVIPGASVQISNPVSGLTRSAITDAEGGFRFTNVPFNPYHLTVSNTGFVTSSLDVDVRSGVPTKVAIELKLGSTATTINVTEEGGDLIENDSTFHTDVDRGLFEKVPLESSSSSVSSLVTLTTPGVAADSNGLFHGLGDHAQNTFSVDGQPISDQQSKVFSNQIPSGSIQSLEVISGAPPAEFGDKTSLVIKVTTRSGLGVDQPHGSVSTSYGSFGTASTSADLAYGGKNWGNFVAVSGLRSGRFLDPPETVALHDKGNEENVFDRGDYKLSDANTFQLNLGYSRSWFQTPNSFDAQNAAAWSGLIVPAVCPPGKSVSCGGFGPDGLPVGPQDQRAKINTFNIAPTFVHLISNSAVLTAGAFFRQDQFNYYPSPNPFADLTPNLQSDTIAQSRHLTNAGLHSDVSYVRGIHNIKAGATVQHTFLTENDTFGIVDPGFNSPCLLTNPDFSTSPDTNPAVTSPGQCGGPMSPGTTANPNFSAVLGCIDLSRPVPAVSSGCSSAASASHFFRGHTDVKQVGLYLQDTITKGRWSFNLGIRGDLYRGMTHATQAEPRLGVAYNIKPTNTVLRISYARTLETPFNENLVLASAGCNDPVLNALQAGIQGSPCITNALSPGWRNEFHAGFQQAFGKYLMVEGEYLWKYTHLAYDFSVFGNTPITFPIEWQRSKVPGYLLRATVPNFHGLTAYFVASSVAARFFQPQVSGIGVTPAGQGGAGVFRIDHDELFNQTTHIQYQPWKRGPWLGFNWRYDSGLVAGAVPFATSGNPLDPGFQVDLAGLSADQQIQAGLFCGSVVPTLSSPLTTCPGNQFGSTLVKIPSPGAENDDKNPPRIQPRNLFDVSIGHDNLFHGDRYRWSLQFTAINVTNKTALYNFLSTFSGTHYVTPRTETVELAFHF
ncbi:MAG TPA: TonB-dependent receptor [Candidatus Acidoferrum sp.]|nr:TonB-dependent receptor [Candidatus Acidoferrum sp.]